MDDITEVLLGLLLGAIGMYWLFSLFRKRKNKEITEKQSVILLEKIRSVCKLITVEGDFAEIYHYENVKERFLNLVSSKKKALIIINAKAHIGYDLRKLKLQADNIKKKIVLSSFPEPEVLTIDQEIKYYDIKDGLFNKFASKDLTDLHREAKKHILEKIPESGLIESAKKEALEAILMIEKIVATIGWKLDYTALEIGTEETKLLDETKKPNK
ncbi:DUF4230 domain-containing protein [Abyssalbus ytuae]|uniref:DUF4230 domain-containing protein n=1 Tax=Abyssalbus ytuae TaxID=2926907 RepID=A0A9E6ZR82_9FLAO|nr:DUF4230 domain-containing protein [Abyssalbus ytuae]UOB19080.1 DUF4230 domain-containing protein [Abyssalbus ytuae]